MSLKLRNKLSKPKFMEEIGCLLNVLNPLLSLIKPRAKPSKHFGDFPDGCTYPSSCRSHTPHARHGFERGHGDKLDLAVMVVEGQVTQ